MPSRWPESTAHGKEANPPRRDRNATRKSQNEYSYTETGRDKDSRTTNAVPVEAVMVGLVGYVYKELDNVIERRRLMASVQNAGPSPFRP
jgi:hypothetical protein